MKFRSNTERPADVPADLAARVEFYADGRVEFHAREAVTKGLLGALVIEAAARYAQANPMTPDDERAWAVLMHPSNGGPA